MTKTENLKALYRKDPSTTPTEAAKAVDCTRRLARRVKADMWEGAREAIKTKIVEKNESTIGVISDVHVPYHDVDAVERALSYLEKRGIDELIMLGDICDMYKVSFFKGDPNRMSFLDEMGACKEFIRGVRARFPKAKMTYVMGNHEVRLQRYLNDKAPELSGLGVLKVEAILELEKLGIEFVDNVERLCNNERPLTRGRLTFLHGHEIRASYGAVNVPRLYFQKTNTNVLFGHIHRRQDYITKDLFGELHGGWSIGCLCHLREAYMPHNEWTSGFGIVTVDQDTGSFTVESKMIFNGKII